MLSHIAHDPQPTAETSSAPLSQRRAHAAGVWDAAGLPTPRLESWKHTSLRPMTRALESASPMSVEAAAPELEGVSGVVILVNGVVDLAASSVPTEITLLDLTSDAPASLGSVAPLERLEDALSARNLASFDRGVAIQIAANTRLVAPLELRYLYTEGGRDSIESRLLIEVAHHAELNLIERHYAPDGLVQAVNHVVEIDLQDGATLRHTQVQQQSLNAYHLAKCAVRQARDSRYEAQVAQFGARIGRSDVEVFLMGAGASCQLDGFYHGHTDQHLDNHSAIHHLASHTTSGQHYKGVLDDKATGIFRGNVLIYPESRGCSTEQLNRNLLLSERATVHTKPQLEIDNDDVTASHGATVGQLDETAMFYLRSRGISTKQARRLLIFAFAGEIVANITLPALQELLRDELALRLARL